jgi:hypothetical protein
MEGEIKSSQSDHDYDDISDKVQSPTQHLYIYGKKKLGSVMHFCK